MNQAERRFGGSESRLDIRTAAGRHECSRNTIYNLIKKRKLQSEMMVVAGRDGRDGRDVKKHLTKLEDLDIVFSTEEQDLYGAALRAAAPPLAEDQKARLAVLLNPGTRHCLGQIRQGECLLLL